MLFHQYKLIVTVLITDCKKTDALALYQLD